MLHDFIIQAERLREEYINIINSKHKFTNIIARHLICKEIDRLLNFVNNWPLDQISYKDIINFCKFIYSTEDDIKDYINDLSQFSIYGYKVNILGSKCIIRIRYKEDPSAWISITSDLYSNIIITENEYNPINGYRRESLDKVTELLISEIFIRFIHGYLSVYLKNIQNKEI